MLNIPQNQMGEKARPETQVENQLNESNRLHDELLNCCFALENRLYSVLRQPDPPPDKNLAQPQDVLVPLAEQIRHINNTTRRVITLLTDIYERSELPDNP
jgi:hypothetical protein